MYSCICLWLRVLHPGTDPETYIQVIMKSTVVEPGGIVQDEQTQLEMIIPSL